jgi:hypothetical protein
VTDREKHGEAGEDPRIRADRAASGDAIRVADDLPVVIPLTAAELDAVESYLGPLLSSLLDASPSNVTGADENA